MNFRYCTVEDFKNDTEMYNSASDGNPESLICPLNSNELILQGSLMDRNGDNWTYKSLVVSL